MRPCGKRKRDAAGCREVRKKEAAPCGQPHVPATGLAACADAGRAAANCPACKPRSMPLPLSFFTGSILFQLFVTGGEIL